MHVDVHLNAESDLDRVWVDNPRAAAAIDVLIEQLKADPLTTIDKLTTHGDNLIGDSLVNVKAWQKVLKKADIWRLRSSNSPSTLRSHASTYRIIYGYQWRSMPRQLCILAIVKRENFDYDNLETSINRRIIADWKEL